MNEVVRLKSQITTLIRVIEDCEDSIRLFEIHEQALRGISKNTCCNCCGEAAKVAQKALDHE